MRRFPAILLVLVFSFTLIAPALSVGALSDVPACCRREGKHHCVMMDGSSEAPPPGPAVSALRMRCPWFPHGHALLPHSGTALPVALQPLRISEVRGITLSLEPVIGYRIPFDRSHCKRGPPSLL